MSVIIFLAVLFTLVIVHEFGHYFVAKRTGMRVDEFGVGFPPKLFGIKRNETEYTLNALPLGGFVRIYGENGDEGIAETDRRAFTHKSKVAQAAVLIAGVTANVLFAWFLFTAAYMYGVESVIREDEAAPGAHLTVFAIEKASPAAEAGILPGDRITKIENTISNVQPDVLTPKAVSELIQKSSGEPLSVTLSRHTTSRTITLTPANTVGEGTTPRIGIRMSLVAKEQYSFFSALKKGFGDTVGGLYGITAGIGGLIRDSWQGDADLSSVAGPVGIAGLAGDASRFGFSSLLLFTAFISLNLAVINMLPLPALDGGRLLMVGIEAITRRKIPHGVSWRINAVGFLLLLALMVFVTYHDILKLVR